jgi:hypothetical protein
MLSLGERAVRPCAALGVAWPLTGRADTPGGCAG